MDAQPRDAVRESCYYVHRYRDIHSAGVVGDDELVVIERPWLDVVAELPPAVYKHRFGT